jgi:hypothetical protein
VRILWAAVDEEEHAGGRKALHQAVEQCLRLRVDPVEILEDQQRGLSFR